VAGLLAIPVPGLVLYGVFDTALDRQLKLRHVPALVRRKIARQRSRLAAAETSDPQGRQSVDDAFLAGFRVTAWLGVALAGPEPAALPLLSKSKSGLRFKGRIYLVWV
jgi:hypothetical protein